MSEQITPNPSVPSQVVAEVTFPKFINNLGIIPTSYKDSMSYYECLAWLCKYLEETVIPTVNQNGTAVEELQGLYIELNTYVTNYFNNLDVQQEINNKLDEMTITGALQEIVNNYFQDITDRIDEQDDILENAINSQNSEINLLKTRMDGFTHLAEGSTTADAEIADARIGYNEEEYLSLGTAIRSQVSDSYKSRNEDFTQYIDYDYEFNLINDSTPYIDNYYISSSTQKIVSASNTRLFQLPVKAGSKISLSMSASTIYTFLSEYQDMTYWEVDTEVMNIVSQTTTASNANYNISVPAGAKYVCFAVNEAGLDSLKCYYSATKSNKKNTLRKKGIKTEKIIDLDYFDKYLEKDYSTNLFNKNSTNKKAGVYVSYSTGQTAVNEAYTIFIIPIDPAQETVSINLTGTNNYAFFDNYVNLDDYDISTVAGSHTLLDGYISGTTSNANISIPETAKSMCLSVRNTNIDSLMVNYGSSALSYVSYKEGINYNKIIGIPDQQLIVVDPNGNGDYTTISSAVSGVSDNSTILIMPGTYEESVDIRTTGKLLRLIGFNRDLCKITMPVTDYSTPPLEIGEGLVENLTLECTGYETVPGQLTAYCAHIDYDSEANSSLQFKNCKFINTIRECIGIGTRENCNINFTNCEFVSERRVIFCHEASASNKSNQNVEFIDCSLKGGEDYSVIRLQENSEQSGNSATIKFQRCIVKNIDYPTNIIDLVSYPGAQPVSGGNRYLDGHVWYLNVMSALNNESALNN